MQAAAKKTHATAARKKAVAKPKTKTQNQLVVHRPAPLPEPRSFLEVLARAAADKTVDSGKMREILNMQREIDQEEARRVFNDAFLKLQEELPSIAQTGKIIITDKNDKTKIIQTTLFATFNEINRVTRPILQRNGFALSFSTEPGSDGRINVIGVLKHRRGHEEKTTFPLPLETSGSKNNVQGVGSSLSYGKRYATIALLNLVSHAPEDADVDGRDVPDKQVERTAEPAKASAPVKITPAEAAALIKLVDSSGVGGVRFCEKYGIAQIADLPPALLTDATRACENFANRPTK